MASPPITKKAPDSLLNWLELVEDREPSYPQFNLSDFYEKYDLSADVEKKIIDGLSSSLIHPIVLEELEKRGWKKTRDKLMSFRKPKYVTLKRGDFGETLLLLLLLEHFQYIIPVVKLRFRVTKGQSLPGTDLVAIKLSDGKLIEFCYVESKLRTYLDYGIGAEGYLQLQKDYNENIPAILIFILNVLAERKDPLLHVLLDYLRRRDDIHGVDRFILGLTLDSTSFSESVLKNICDCENIGNYPRCIVTVVKLNELRTKIDYFYGKIGATAEDEN